MERHLRKVYIIAFLVVASIIVINIVIDNPYTHRIARAALSEKVEQYTNLIVDFESINISLMPLEIQFYGVFIATTSDPRTPLVTASQLSARASLSALFFGELRIGRLATIDMNVRWPPPWNFTDIIKEEYTADSTPGDGLVWPPDFPVFIEDIDLQNARILFDHPLETDLPMAPDWLSLEATGLNLEATITKWTDIELAVRCSSVNAARQANSILEDANLEANLVLQGHEIETTLFRIEGERLQLEGKLEAELEADRPEGIQVLEKPLVIDRLTVSSAGAVEGDLSVLGSLLDLAETRGHILGKYEANVAVPIKDDSADLEFSVKADVKVDQGLLDGFRLYDSRATLHADLDKLSFPSIDAIIAGKSVGTASGEIRFDDAVGFEFEIEPKSLRLMDLLAVFDVDFDVLDTGISSSKLTLKGRGDPFYLRVTGKGNFAQFDLPATPYAKDEFPQSPSCDLDVDIRVDANKLQIVDGSGLCTSAAATMPLLLSGPITFDNDSGLQLAIKSPAVNAAVGNYFAQVPLEGKGSIDTLIHGGYDNVVIDGRVELKEARAAGIVLGEFGGTFQVDGEQLRWRNVVAKPTRSARIESKSGHMNISDLSVHTSVNFSNIDELTVEKSFQYLLPGRQLSFGLPDLAIDFSGPILYPLAFQGSVSGKFTSLRWDSEKLFDRSDLHLVSDESGWKVDDSTLQLGSLAVDLKGLRKPAFPFSEEEAEHSKNPWVTLGLHPDDHYSLEVSSRTVGADAKDSSHSAPENFRHLKSLPYAGTYLQTIDLDGELHLTGKVTGHMDALQGTVEGAIDNPTVFGSKLSPFVIKAFILKTKVDTVISHAGDSFEGRFSVDFGEEGLPYEWFFNFKRTDLRALGTPFFYKDPRNYLYLTAEWRMKGALQDWWHSTGDLKINDIRMQFASETSGQTKYLRLRQQDPARLDFKEQGWQFSNDGELYLQDKFINLRASLAGNSPPERLNVKISSVVDIGLIRDFVPDVDSAAGKLQIEVMITGAVDDPKFTVTVEDQKLNPFIAGTWKPVQIGFADMRPPFTNIKIKAGYENSQVVIHDLKAAKGAGTVSARGTLNLGAHANVTSRLDIRMKNATLVFPVDVLKDFEAQLSGNVAITGKGLPFKVRGNIVVDRARATREIDIRNEIVGLFQRQTFNTRSLKEKPHVEFDLNISADRTINIHNRNIQSNLSADVRIRGTDIDPLLRGQIEVNKGIFFYNREFKFARGIVLFDNPVRVDPSLDILLYSDIRAYRVYIAVTGRLSDPIIDLSIDPPTRENGVPITKEEIFALISNGQLPEASRAAGDVQSAATSQAINLIMGQFEEPIERLFDLSGQTIVRRVYVDTYPSEEGDPVPRLNLPLDLGEEFDVVFRMDRTKRQLSSEYSIHENITLSGNVIQNTNDEEDASRVQERTEDASVDLDFRFSFD